MMSPQTKKQKTEETMNRHGQISNQSGMAVVNEHENRVENGASQTHQEHSTNGSHESNIATTVTPGSKQGRGNDGKQEPKTKPSWLTLIGGHAIDFNDSEYVEEEYPAYGIVVSVSEDGSEVDVRNPTYFTK